ncbi:MAG: hypothetical protein JKY53_00030, partial [Flavobacteriales bacterium]|nr:hypothetical protein [Flavobacteriales bacterium]
MNIHKQVKRCALSFALSLGAVAGYAQCDNSGTNVELLQNHGAGALLSPQHRVQVVFGQPLISTPTYSTDKSYVAGYWSRLLIAPSVGSLNASDGDEPDRIVLNWSLAPNTSAPDGGYNIYRNGSLLNTVANDIYTFNDFNVIPGVFYEYAVSGKNSYGEGVPFSDVGYVNPNGVVSGRITTFAGNSVEGAVVALTPSTNLSVNFQGAGGIYVDTIVGNAAPIFDSIFTVSLWMKAGGPAYATNSMLLDCGRADSTNMWIELGSDNSVKVRMADATGSKQVKYIFTSDEFEWHHIAGVYNGRELILYVDGQVRSSTQVDIANVNYSNHQIGIATPAEKANATNQFNGFIDDVRILNVVQRPSELRKFMYNTLPKDYTGLKAYWKMDEGKGFKISNLFETARPGFLCNSDYATEDPGVKSSGISNSSGYYVIPDVNYGAGTSFNVTPSKYVSFNYALEFSSTEQNYATSPNFGIDEDATFELWFSPYVLNGTQYILSANGGTQFDIYLEGNQLKLNIDGQVETVGTIGTTDYHLLTLVKNQGSITTYIDSDVATSQTLSFGFTGALPLNTWTMGAATGLSDYYSGLIDGIVVWNEMLDIPTIQLHNTLGVLNVMTEVAGYPVVDERI